jgi:ribose 5-phosphate isomerase B
MASIQEQVVRLVAEVLERSAHEVGLTDRFIEDLGASSLDIMTLVIRIEQHFHLSETPEAKLEQIHTVGDLVQMVASIYSGEPSQVHEVVEIAIASDHAGIALKAELVEWLMRRHISVVDLGPADSQQVDYPDFAQRVGRRVRDKEARLGVLICGSGVGMSIAANKMAGIRAALVSEPISAALAREHNDANVLCLGARMIGGLMAQRCVEAFMATAFTPGDDGRHRRRVEAIHRLEQEDHGS